MGKLTPAPTDWLAEARRFTAGAKRAREAGDTAAALALAIGAAQCLQLAKLIQPADSTREGRPHAAR